MIRRSTSKTPIEIYCWCFQVVLVLVLASVAAWLSLIPKSPSFAISDFRIPASNRTNSSVSHRGEVVPNTSLSFNLTISNPNKGTGIQYSDIHITLYHKGASIGTRPVIPGFYQSHKKSVSCSVLVNAGGQFWRGIGNGNIVVLRAGLETGVRYQILRWKTEKHRMDFEAFVIIDRQGRIDGEKNISLHRIPS